MLAVACLAAIVLGATFAATTFSAAPAQAADTNLSTTGPTCTDRYFSVGMGLVPLTVHGRLCLPAIDPATADLQVLIPGATYSGGYWDSPVEGGAYSYVQHANANGFATLDLDRVGTGKSDRPLSALVTASGEAQVVHEVISQVRAGLPHAPTFSKIALVGHSLGSLISVIESATYHDENAVILTGYSTSIQAPTLLRTFLGGLVPAALDPALHTLDPGYLTTAPGQRERLFDAPTDVDPTVVAWDEQTKSVVAATEVADALLLGESPAETRSISVPVLLANGSQDAFFCGGGVNCASDTTLVASEATDFSSAARLSATVLPSSGHDNSLALNANQFYVAAAAWLRGTAGMSDPDIARAQGNRLS